MADLATTDLDGQIGFDFGSHPNPLSGIDYILSITQKLLRLIPNPQLVGSENQL